MVKEYMCEKGAGREGRLERAKGEFLHRERVREVRGAFSATAMPLGMFSEGSKALSPAPDK